MSIDYQNQLQTNILQGFAYGRANRNKERTIITDIVKATREKRLTIENLINRMRKEGYTL